MSIICFFQNPTYTYIYRITNDKRIFLPHFTSLFISRCTLEPPLTNFLIVSQYSLYFPAAINVSIVHTCLVFIFIFSQKQDSLNQRLILFYYSTFHFTQSFPLFHINFRALLLVKIYLYAIPLIFVLLPVLWSSQ